MKIESIELSPQSNHQNTYSLTLAQRLTAQHVIQVSHQKLRLMS
jgi:hypothetical protein